MGPNMMANFTRISSMDLENGHRLRIKTQANKCFISVNSSKTRKKEKENTYTRMEHIIGAVLRTT
jgi:hypothetical protein